MTPQSPVVPGLEQHEIKIAENQDEYETLPALPVHDGDVVITRWNLTFLERLRLLFNGNLYLWIWRFRQPLQPVLLSVDKPEVYATDFEQEESQHA